jgi:hypothetical protein
VNRAAAGAIVLLVCALAGAAWAQTSGGDFRVARSVIAGGSARASGGAFTLSATVGQHDATTPASGGDFRVSGGFWPESSTPSGDAIFDDGFEAQ